LKDKRRGDLVAARLSLAGVKAGVAHRLLGVTRGESLVPRGDRHLEGLCQSRHRGLGPPGLLAFPAVHENRHPHYDPGGLLLGHEAFDGGHEVSPPLGFELQKGVRDGTIRVADGDADAPPAEVQPQNPHGGMIARPPAPCQSAARWGHRPAPRRQADAAIGRNNRTRRPFRLAEGMTERTGDPTDVERLLVSFAPRVYGLLLRMVGRPDVAEDLMQETLLRALRSMGTYRPEGRFRAWVFRIAVNLARDWIRRRPRERVAPLGDEGNETSPGVTPAADSPPDADAMGRERAQRVELALARLPNADREVLLMRYYGDLTFKTIARATGEPLGTVLARAHRALKKLGDMIPGESHESLP